MNDEIYEKYRRAGKIAAEARDYGCSLLRPGARFVDIASSIELKIKQRGASLAFPVNLAINSIAAHYSPCIDDPLMFKKGDVVKVDVGAHIDGYIADTAMTVEIETTTYAGMIKASSDALDNALRLMKAGVNLSTIGKTVEQTILSQGFKPIDNLMGHGLQQYELHSGLSVPNVGSYASREKPQAGDVLAVEPFATNGAGHVISGSGSHIYLCSNTFKARLIRDSRSKYAYEKIHASFRSLPFAQRWCLDVLSESCDTALKKLSFLGVIKQYPQLLDAKGGMVTQKEHTVIVREHDCEVIT